MAYWLAGVGGFVGAIIRYAIQLVLPTASAGEIPTATLIANWSGSFFLLFLLSVTDVGGRRREQLRLLLGTGLLSSFTTFSALSAETFDMLDGREWLNAFVYVAATAIGGLGFALVGYKAGTAWIRREEQT